MLRFIVLANRARMLRQLTSNKTFLRRLFLLALLLSILPFLILTYFCHPAYDDFCISAHALTTGFIERQINVYKVGAGRYFSTLVLTFSPLNVGSFAGYKAFGVATILLTFVSIFCLIHAIVRSAVPLIDKLIATSFLAALFSNQAPDITEAYFWTTGEIVYQLPLILSMLFFAVVIRSSDKSKGAKLFRLFLSCLLIVAIVGSNETSMLVIALLIFTITIAMWMAKSEQRWSWLIFSIITIFCVAVVIAAPGNTVRSSVFPGRHRFFYSLGMSFRQEVSFLLIWLSNFAFVFGTFLFIPIAGKLSDTIPFFRHIRVSPIVSSILLLFLVFLGLFPAYWGTGMMGQHRTVNTVYFFFLIGWFVNIVIWVDFLKRRRGFTFARLPNYVYVVGVPILLCTLLFSNNTKIAIADLVRGRAYRYDKLVYRRYAQFEQCARDGNVDNCPVERITDLPTTITNPYYETEVQCEKWFWKARAQSSGSR